VKDDNAIDLEGRERNHNMNKASIKFVIFLPAAVLILSLTGCRGESSHMMTDSKPDSENIMARIGDEAITREDVDAALERIPKRKHQAIMNRVLDDLIEDRVFSQEARNAKLDEDPNVRKALDKVRNETLARYFVKKHLDKEAEPSKEALKKFYLEHEDQFVVPEAVLIHHIVVKDKEKAGELLKALETGESFEALAKKNSICRCYKNEGHHGWLFKGKMEPELEQISFNIEKGILSEIIKTKDGYQLIKVIDRQDQRLIPFEEAESKIQSRLFRDKKRGLIDKYYEEANVNTHPTEEGVLVKIGDEVLTEEILAPILDKIQEDKKQEAKLRWIDYFIETRVFSEEAKKAYIEDDPDVARELRRKTDQVLANIFRKRFLSDKFSVSDKDIGDYYLSHPEEFRTPLKIRAKSILVNTMEEAEEILKEVKDGESFGYLAMKKSLHPEASRRSGEIGWFEKGEKDPALEKVAFSLEKGEISEIIKTIAGYEIIKLMDRKGGEIRPLDEVKQTIKMTLVMQRFDEEKQRYYKKAEVKVIGP